MLTPHEENIILYSGFISSVFGTLGSLFIIFSFIFFKESRSFGTKLVFFLSISDFGFSLSTSFFWKYVNNEHKIACTTQGVLIQFFSAVSVLWSFFIGFSVYMNLWTERIDIEKLTKYFHIVAWGYPVIAALIPLLHDSYGKLFHVPASYCYIPESHKDDRLYLYAPTIAIFFILLILYVALVVKYRKRAALRPELSSMLKNMGLYLLAFLFSQSPGIANRLQNFAQPTHPIFTLTLLQTIFQPLQGFLDSLVYFWNEPLFIDQYKKCFKHLFKCVNRSSTDDFYNNKYTSYTNKYTNTHNIQASQSEREHLIANITYDDSDP